jgi:hypothetical protein
MSSQPFEIGLVGAGAISAGAYTGGVVDFMVHALDSWYAAREAGELVPPHDVKLSVFSGASAGSITAALAAGYLGSEQPPIADEEAASSHKGKNKLFDCWVERIDIAHLLESRDLQDKQAKVLSLLDSSVLSDIADNGLSVTPRAQRRSFVAENFELLLTVTNLRGIPYAFEVMGSQATKYDMSLHADYMHFRINDSGDGGGLADRYPMRWADFGPQDSPIKERLKASALASGAFPVGLTPRMLGHVIPGNGQPDCYGARLWSVPTPDSEPHQCRALEPRTPSWDSSRTNFQFDFQCVDGGVMNNEPLELARQALAGPHGHNPRSGKLADKAVLLIDPFPSSSSFDSAYRPAEDLLGTLLRLFDALKNQARFKPDELLLAARTDVHSRFMIAPSRGGQRHAVACGGLGGFGGFLKRDFRAHDYFLGRRNAQKFLRDHFTLPENNPLFDPWDKIDADARAKYCVRDQAGQPVTRDGQRLLPIIPLVGDATAECRAPAWPRYTEQDLAKFTRQLESRVDVVLDRLVAQYFDTENFLVRLIAGFVLGAKKKDMTRKIGNHVEDELRDMELIR